MCGVSQRAQAAADERKCRCKPVFVGLSQLEIDITYGSMDPTLGQTHFTLPEVNHSVDYDHEEAEMDELLQKLDKACPVDASFPGIYMTNKYASSA